MTKLFVGCLPYSKTQEEILGLFSQFGLVTEVFLHKKPDGSPKGAAFVVFQQMQHAEQAVAGLNGYVYENSPRGITVSFASSKSSSGGSQSEGVSSGLGLTHQGLPGNPPPPSGKPPIHKASMAAQAVAAQAGFGGCGDSGYGKGGDWGGKGGDWSGKGCGWDGKGGDWGGKGADWSGKGGWWYGGGQMDTSHQVASSMPGCKLFVGQLPYSKGESDIWQLFGNMGPISEVALLRDKAGQSKGAAFVKFQTPHHAASAISTLDGFIFTGATRPISVRLAQGEDAIAAIETQGSLKRSYDEMSAPTPPSWGKGDSFAAPFVKEEMQTEEGSKLFVGQLPFSRSEDDIHQLFSQYGAVAEVVLHRDAAGKKKGGAFVRFWTAAHAMQALVLDGYLFEGSTRPITVSVAGEGKRQRLH
mmetsp:Transcript_102427/g.181911  ORF Transcript_102427/g.181911 Transcript_102427/m.181911 type:complete len:415 (+) Transcript_102427:33-1277(+)